MDFIPTAHSFFLAYPISTPYFPSITLDHSLSWAFIAIDSLYGGEFIELEKGDGEIWTPAKKTAIKIIWE